MYSQGYYRDSYNDSNLLWQLGLDYWTWFAKFLDQEGQLSADNANAVLAEVEARNHLLAEIEDKDEAEYFKSKYKEFVDFLRTAIELEEPIACSI